MGGRPETAAKAVAGNAVLGGLGTDGAELLVGLTAASGDPFLEWVTDFLRRACGADYAFVGELRGEDLDRVRTLAVADRNGRQPDFGYGLAGTPCANVVRRDSCSYPNGVQRLFPEDELLADMGVESYVGTPLFDAARRPLGLVVVLGTQAWQQEACDEALTSLELFRPRLESELVGRRAARELELIVEGTGSNGEDAIASLTLALARAMQVKSTFVCERTESGDRMRTLALVVDDQIRPEFEFDCEGTPCQAAYGTGRIFVPAGVRDRFPDDGVLQWLGAEAYLGIVFRDASGEPLGHLGLIHDGPLSDGLPEHPLVKVFAARAASELQRIRAEKARLEAERRLLQSQRLESLGLLAGGVAHDFNNLLVGILGNADIVQTQLPEGVIGDRVGEVILAAERAAALCQELLAYAGRGSLRKERVDLNALLGEISRLLTLSISDLCEVRHDLAADLPPVEGDPAQLQQVVMNLITNASEALEDHPGAVTLSTAFRHCTREELESWPAIGQVPEGACIVLEVSDTGTGLDADTRQRIFDPFFTTRGQGRGLGLAAVLGIVQSHRGAICVQSKQGVGTTFRVYLPASEVLLTTVSDHGSARASNRTGSVLVVDDEETVRLVVKTMLESEGFEVVTASGGAEAIRLAAEHAGAIDCVLLDLVMPGLSGEDTLLELKRAFPQLPIVISSGNADPARLAHLAPGLIDGVLGKPYRGRDLIARIREVLSPER